MSGPVIKVARTAKYLKNLNNNTEYAKRMRRLSNQIFCEVTTPTDPKSMRVVELLASEPVEQREDKSQEYYPNQPMFHYLTKMLKLHGLYYDEHLVWREYMNELRMYRGKSIQPPIGAGKQRMKKK